MGLMETGIKAAGGNLPKVISPKAHAILDYAIAASFFVAAALLWRRHRRAAMASVVCGLAEVATAALTDYPGGMKPLISFENHERLDGGIASLVGAIPIAMNFAEDPEARIFRGYGIGIAAITALTDYEGESRLTSGWSDVA